MKWMREIINEIVDVLGLKGLDVQSIYLTGSRLYGFSTEESDYDFKVYVYPTCEDVVLNKMYSKEIVLDHPLCEKVDVKDWRYQYKELTKPSFNSLHLLQSPVYGNKVFGDYQIEESFTNGIRNLILSLLGTIRSRKNDDSLKSISHLYFLHKHAINLNSINFVGFEYFRSGRSKLISERCREIRSASFYPEVYRLVKASDLLFESIVSDTVESKSNNHKDLVATMVAYLN